MEGVTSCLREFGIHAPNDSNAADGGKQVINELVKFIMESLPFIVSKKQISFMEKYEALALMYELPSLDTPSSSDKPAKEIDRMAFKDELKRSVLLDINCKADDTPESRTADGYKTHLDHLNKRLKSNGCDAIYMACMIGQCLTELKHIYPGNKLLKYATIYLFAISCVLFSLLV